MEVRLPLRVLVIRSGPADYPCLNLDAEWAQVAEALAEPTSTGLLAITELAAPTLSELRRTLSPRHLPRRPVRRAAGTPLPYAGISPRARYARYWRAVGPDGATRLAGSAGRGSTCRRSRLRGAHPPPSRRRDGRTRGARRIPPGGRVALVSAKLAGQHPEAPAAAADPGLASQDAWALR